MHRLSNQRGSAIIIALFVMSLAAGIAVFMLARAHIDIRRTELIMTADRAELYAQGSLDWAIIQLKNNVLQKKSNQVTDRMPIHSNVTTVNGYQIESTIEDMQALFNLNNVKDADYQKNFIRLLHGVMPKMSLADLMHIVLATRDWVVPNSDSEISTYYAKLNLPYRSPHRPMASVSEWRLVKGVTPEIYQIMLPYLTALPETTPLNINTTPVILFSSLSPQLNAESMHALDNKRKQALFESPEAFMNLDIIKNNPVTANQITVLSSYFLVKTSVTVSHQKAMLYTLLLRGTKDSKPVVSTVWQTKGTL